MNHWGWRPYVPVAKRRQNAKRLANQLSNQGKPLEPIEVQGRAIARTFWGKAWCDNLESYSDFANRLPRGRTYVRNGSVIDLKIESGRVSALVSGSDIYEISIQLTPLQDRCWKAICADCSGSIDSLLDLLAGKFDRGVMQRLTRKGDGLFPKPDEIKLDCSCPDWATMCKHVAAVLYGVGTRLDDSPELLFLLRNVDHALLLGQASLEAVDEALGAGSSSELDGEDLSALFGIELESVSVPSQDGASAEPTSPVSPHRRSSRKAARKSAKKPASRKRKQEQKQKQKSSTTGLASQNRAVTKAGGTQKKAATKKKAKVTKKAKEKESRRQSTSKEATNVVATKRKSAQPKKKAARRTPVQQETAIDTKAKVTKPKGVKGVSRKATSAPAKGTRARAGSQRAAKR
jgi:uncharacterized Zn finger protein